MAHNTTYFDDGTITRTQFERFWTYVDVRGPDDCWIWRRARTCGDYGAYRVGLRSLGTLQQLSAHRIAFFFAHHHWPNICRHSCDNPPCCNPKHLMDGTQADNIADAMKRNRLDSRKGSRNRCSKLVEADIVAIRERYSAGGITHKALATEYGVRRATITAVLCGQNWGHVKGAQVLR